MSQKNSFEQTSPLQPCDLDTIFIARKQPIKLFHTFLNAWQQLLSQNTANTLAFDKNCIQSLVILIHGENGFGKSTLLRQYHQIAQVTDPAIQVSQIMDQKDTLDMGNGLFEAETDPELEAIHYFVLLQGQIALALQKNNDAFKSYRTALREIEQTRKEIYRTLNRETRAHTSLLAGLVQHISKGRSQEIPPQAKLAQALGADLQWIAKHKPLLLFFDTYEKIDEGDPLLRNVMRSSGPRVGWIIAGQDDYWNENEQARRGFSSAASYQKHILLDRAFSVALNPGTGGDFTVSNIQSYFAEIHKLVPALPPIHTDDAQRIRQITQGIPQAVRFIAEIYLRKPDICAITAGSDDIHHVVDKMIHLYFSHIPDIPSIRAKLYGLASLRRINNTRAVQQALEFGAGQESDADYVLLQMHRQYGFVLTENGQPTLHENVRHFLRRHLLGSVYDPEQTHILAQLQQAQVAQLEALEKQRSYPDLFSRLADDTWIETYLDLVEAQCWANPYEAMRSSLAFLLVASLYRQEVCLAILAIVQPFEPKLRQPYLGWWHTAIRSLFHPPQHMYDVVPTIARLEQIEQLIQQKKLTFPPPFAEYTEKLCAALSWQKGEIYRPYDEQKALPYYQSALASFYQGKEYDVHLAQLYWILAYQQSQQQAYQQSVAYLTQALLLKPDFAEAHYNLGNAYYELGQYDAAMTSYHYTIELEPTHLDAWINLGNTHMQRKAYRQAIHEYTYALRFDPQSADLYFNRANAYKKEQAYLMAVKDFTMAIDLDPTFIEAFVNRGNTYTALKMRPQALDDYQKASSLAPDDIHPRWMQEWISFDKQLAGPEIARRLEALAQTDPKHYIAAICRGIAQGLQTLDIKTALIELDQAIIQAPEQWDSYFWRCMLRAYLGRYQSAQQDMQQALDNGLPTLLLLPLYWLQEIGSDFFTLYARPVLDRANL